MYSFFQKCSQVILAFILFASIGCQTKPATQAETKSLSNTSWELKNLNNRPIMTSSMGDGIYITFEPNENRISGFGGCNRYFGNYRSDETSNQMTFDGIGSTKMMCNNISFETEYFNALRLVTRYEKDGQTLQLFQGETVVAAFSKIPYRRQ